MARGFFIAIACCAMTLACVSLQAAGQPKVVCESDASGAATICRDAWPGEDAAAFRRVAPTPSVPTGAAAAPTRPMLAPAPTREASAAPAPAYLRAGDASEPNAPSIPPIPATAIVEKSAPVVAERAAESKPPIAETVTPSVAAIATTEPKREPATTPAPVVASAIAKPVERKPTFVVEAARPTRVAESEAETRVASPAPPPAPLPAAPKISTVAAPPAVITNAPAETKPTVPAASIATATQAPAPPAPAAPAASTAPVVLLNATAFRALDGSRYTMELANAKSPEPLRDLAARLQLAGEVYLVHLRSPESDRWLLTWADYASQSDARSARAMVPADSAINSGWPRRIAPLQNELVSP